MYISVIMCIHQNIDKPRKMLLKLCVSDLGPIRKVPGVGKKTEIGRRTEIILISLLTCLVDLLNDKVFQMMYLVVKCPTCLLGQEMPGDYY